ncbi:MAG: purine-binding chemotaxis protein CheW [Pirellulales bacterium]|nr:purine-binding chemotaxis protein CheW [Pirellulales bacterium]
MTTTIPETTDRRDRRAGTVHLVVFRLAGERYAVEIAKVREIVPASDYTRLPHAPDYVLGLINLRGEVVPLVDLRRRLGLPAEQWNDETRMVVVEVGGKKSALAVDEVVEVSRIGEERVIPSPSTVAGPEREYLSGLVQQDDRLLVLLNVDALLKEEEWPAAESVAV